MASTSAIVSDKIAKLLKSRDKLEKKLSDLHVVIHEDLSSSTRRHSRVSRLLRSADDKLQECYDKNDELRKSAYKTINPEATIAELENWEAQLLAKRKTNTECARQFIATSDPEVSAPSVPGTKSIKSTSQRSQRTVSARSSRLQSISSSDFKRMQHAAKLKREEIERQSQSMIKLKMKKNQLELTAREQKNQLELTKNQLELTKNQLESQLDLEKNQPELEELQEEQLQIKLTRQKLLKPNCGIVTLNLARSQIEQF